MNLTDPLLLLWMLPLAAFIVWARSGSPLPETRWRRRALLVTRLGCLLLLLLALTAPVFEHNSAAETVIFVIDHSRSVGAEGLDTAKKRTERLRRALPAGSRVGIIAAGASPRVLQPLNASAAALPLGTALRADAARSDLGAALATAAMLLRQAHGGRIVLMSDGLETKGDALHMTHAIERAGLRVDVIPIRGRLRSDARLVRLRSSQSQLRRGATVALSAELTCTLDTRARVRLFENGREVETRELRLQASALRTEVFERKPATEGSWRYLARVEALPGPLGGKDAVPENDLALSQVDVHSAPRFLLLTASSAPAVPLVQAMAAEGIEVQALVPAALPTAPRALEAYDGVILLDVPAKALPPQGPEILHRYVHEDGGGFVMIGGARSFALGGYEETPIADLLPVALQPRDKRERYTTALVLVLDRSGSMDGVKIELSKAAAIAAAGILQPSDHIGVVAFDSAPKWIVPLTRADQKDEIRRRVATLDAGGGTNLQPAMLSAYKALEGTSARVKHMIVLTDGRTRGAGYEKLARRALANDITISTVGIGVGADNALLAVIAEAGGGKHYITDAPTHIPRIFAQDTAAHAGDFLREHAFRPQQIEAHAMLKGWKAEQAPALLGYVLTRQRRAAATPLLTDRGDPLLAAWRYGRGKAVAFTSGATPRWARRWIEAGETYTRFWAQLLRDVARPPTGARLSLDLERTAAGFSVAVDLAPSLVEATGSVDVALDVTFAAPEALDRSPVDFAHGLVQRARGGRLGTRMRVEEAGLYVVRARAGDETVSRTFIAIPSRETTSGALSEGLLDAIAGRTGGTAMGAGEDLPSLGPSRSGLRVELTPWLLRFFLLLFLFDLTIRRWPYVLGLADRITSRFKRAPRSGV